LGQALENEAYLECETGAVYWQSDNIDQCDALPDDIGDTDRYVPVPHKNNLGLGKQLTLQFTAKYLAAQLVSVRVLLIRPDAYARFKKLLVDPAILRAWFTYEHNWYDSALRQWRPVHAIVLQDKLWPTRARWFEFSIAAIHIQLTQLEPITLLQSQDLIKRLGDTA